MKREPNIFEKRSCEVRCVYKDLDATPQEMQQCYEECIKRHSSDVPQSHSKISEKSENYDGMDSFM